MVTLDPSVWNDEDSEPEDELDVELCDCELDLKMHERAYDDSSQRTPSSLT